MVRRFEWAFAHDGMSAPLANPRPSRSQPGVYWPGSGRVSPTLRLGGTASPVMLPCLGLKRPSVVLLLILGTPCVESTPAGYAAGPGPTAGPDLGLSGLIRLLTENAGAPLPWPRPTLRASCNTSGSYIFGPGTLEPINKARERCGDNGGSCPASGGGGTGTRFDGHELSGLRSPGAGPSFVFP